MKTHYILPAGLLAALLAMPAAIRAADAPAPSSAKSSSADPKAATAASNTGHNYSSSTSNYVIHAGDTIHVEVTQDPNAARDVVVDYDGTVQLAYLEKAITISGMSIDDARKTIAKKYEEGEIFVSPNVVLRVAQYSDQHVNVVGQVNKAGPVIIPPNQQLKLVDAIAQAGGHTRIAAHWVTVTRHLPDGKTDKIDANLYDAEKGDAKQNITLQDGDTIYVDESTIGW